MGTTELRKNTHMTNDPQQLSANKQALLKIRELKQQIAELQNQQSAVSEPIAIVSMACRFPRRSNTPEAFWQSLIDKTDQVSEIPDDRWDMDAFHDDDPNVPGKMYARSGAFLDNIDLMDPEFFGISPREATWVDPQQRLLMEVGWEALERAGWTPEKIGPHTGIFVGWMHNDYQNEASDSFLNLNPYIATGAAGSFLCGRLAYYLGLQGPSVAVDTACSSSLVALHLACLSLQQRDCDRALVGGVNAICSPTTNILTCKLKALSPSGHSRAFDAAADGYLRGEGCGVVTLRRLADAERDGDPILGVISGSAIGHNGAGGGLTVPNPRAQEQVIRQALERAQLAPQDVAYLEAHGTGTELGDPIEMQAAAAALTLGRDADRPLFVGSVKTNIGHLEAAAGMAGLIKVLLSLQHDCIPGQLNFETPNPHIPWDRLPVQVLTDPTAWPNAIRVAGVSAFGMSGTNAHVILAGHSSRPEQAERSSGIATPQSAGAASLRSSIRPMDEGPAEAPQIITISGKTETAVTELAALYHQQLTNGDSISLADVAFTANTRRSHFEHRAAIVAGDVVQAAETFRDLARGATSDRLVRGNGRRPLKVAWQFTGQGSQYVGMGRRLYQTEPVFRDAIDHCDVQLQDLRSSAISAETLKHVLFEDSNLIDHTSWTQPAIFAVQMGLAKLLQSRGLQPDVVLGHSVGQYAAACVAGILSWDDGLKLISERGRLIGELPPGGLMLAVFTSKQRLEGVLRECRSVVSTERASSSSSSSEIQGGSLGGDHRGTLDDVSIAAFNGTHIVVSGMTDAVESLEAKLTESGIRTKRLTTSHAFHSSLMDPALAPFQQVAQTVTFQKANLPLICNVSGKVLEADTVLTGQYWAEHIREAVRFSDSINTAQGIGCELILELGPQATLTRMAAADWQQPADTLFSCLQKDVDDVESVLQATGRLFVNGVTPDFDSMYANQNRQHVLLPTYPFQRRRFWGPDKPRAAHSEHHTAHPLLGSHLRTPDRQPIKRFENFVDADSPAWVGDHRVMDQVVMPGAAFLEMALAAGKENAVVDAIFEQPLQLGGRTSLQTVVNRVQTTKPRIECHSLGADQETWGRHFRAELTNVGDRPASVDLKALRQGFTNEVNRDNFYAAMADLGLQYGPAFRVIRALHMSASSILTRLAVEGDIRGYRVPPPLLDGALHSLAAKLLSDKESDLFLPVGVERLVSYETLPPEVWCHATWGHDADDLRFADLELYNDNGDVLLTISGLKLRKLDRAAMRRMSGGGAERLVYGIKHQPYSLTPNPVNATNWLIVADRGDGVAEAIQQRLTESGQSVHRCSLQTDAVEMLSAFDAERPLNGIAWLLSDNTEANCTGLLKLIQALKTTGVPELRCGIGLVTRGATHVLRSSAVSAESAAANQDESHGGDHRATMDGDGCNPLQSQYQGFGRVLGAEHPEYRCRLIDLGNDSQKSAERLADILLVDTRENELVMRDDLLVVPRLAKIKASVRRKPRRKPFENWGDRSCLITGGLGSLGRHAAEWLAHKGVPHVVLISRRQPDEQAEQQLQKIRDLGCDVVVHAADVTSRAQMTALIGRFGNDLPELGGVIHAAGVLDDGRIVDQSWDRFAPVIATKVRGAELLDQLTDGMFLNFFILYSSAASVLGSPGQSNYATANAFLDGLARKREHAGKLATSINWGPWDSGMADNDLIKKRLALQGIAPLTVEEAHAAMEIILERAMPQATVMDVDWRRMTMGLGGETPPLLEALTPMRQKSQMGDSAFVGKLKQLRGNAQKELLVKTVQELLQTVLSTPDAPETDRPLIEMGLDSLMAVEFSTQLQMTLGEQFPIGPTMLFDHPTIDDISGHVLEMVAAEGDAEPVAEIPTDAVDVPQLRERESVAIVGMSCRFPGAHDVDEFWQNILNGVDSVCEIPPDRWDVDRFYDADRAPGKMYTKQGGFLDDIADFDAAFFNISDQEACWVDPQHRMLLENSYRALEHAGISPHPLADANVGVFMGIMGQDYAFLPNLDDEEVIKAFEGAGLSHSAGVGRISYVFGFEGPSIAIDTASSSSLVALYQAVRSLQDGNCNMALAGGVNAILAPVNSLLMSKAGLLSPDGRCKSFSAAADGFGRGEGCGVVVLKRLSDAQRDGDTVLAVVRGGAVVHNGSGGGITTPSGKSQSRVITEALLDAKIAPSQVQYLEAHGTGTALGDPMELGAAASVYGKGRKRDQPLLVGSVKGNISHLEAAGGVSGLIKTVLSLHHGIIPPQANFDEPSPHVPWKRLPVKMVTEQTAWPEVEERFAAVTALGLVGTNAHVVLSNAPQIRSSAVSAEHDVETLGGDHRATVAERPSQLLVLSARNARTLAAVAESYVDFLDRTPNVNLADLCHTAAIGRRHYEQRTAVVFDSLLDVRQALTELATGDCADERSVKTTSQPKLAWMFSGDSASDLQAGRQLYATEPAFREMIDGLDERISTHVSETEHADVRLRDWFASEEGGGGEESVASDIHLFAVQAGLVHVWRSWRIAPDAVLGAGVGQLTAACVTGGLSFDDAATLIIQRQIALAAIAANAEDGERAMNEFEAFADTLNYYPPNVQMVDSLNGQVVPVHRILGGSYWRQQLTDSPSPQNLETFSQLNCDLILQIGPDSNPHKLENLGVIAETTALLRSLVCGQAASNSMLQALGQLYVAGCNPDFKSFNSHWNRQRISLPHYPFEKKRYWITEVSKHVP